MTWPLPKANDSYFRFIDENKMKYKHYNHHHKRFVNSDTWNSKDKFDWAQRYWVSLDHGHMLIGQSMFITNMPVESTWKLHKEGDQTGITDQKEL